MLKLVVGFVVGAGLSILVARPWAVAVGLVLVGGTLQVIYAHRLNRVFGGTDPVSLGARSLDQLRDILSVPASVIALDFAAKVAFWGAVTALLSLVGWVRFQ